MVFELIYELNFLGWTQEKIAEAIKLKQNRVSQIIKNISFDKIDNEYKEGKDVSEIAQFCGLEFFIWQTE